MLHTSPDEQENLEEKMIKEGDDKIILEVSKTALKNLKDKLEKNPQKDRASALNALSKLELNEWLSKKENWMGMKAQYLLIALKNQKVDPEIKTNILTEIITMKVDNTKGEKTLSEDRLIWIDTILDNLEEDFVKQYVFWYPPASWG